MIDKIKKLRAPLDLAFFAALVAMMAMFMFFDPFRINFKIIDYLRLNFPIFTKEPKLLFYTSAHIGSFIAKSIAIVAIFIFTLTLKNHPAEDLGLKMPKPNVWEGYLWPFIILSFAARLYYTSNPLVPNLPIRLVFPEAMLIGNLIMIPSTLLVAPVTEELIFRGYMFGVLKKSFGAYAAILIVSLLFAAAHIPTSDFDISWLAVIFAGGIALGALREKTNSILVPVFFHFLYNLVSIAVGAFNFFILGY